MRARRFAALTSVGEANGGSARRRSRPTNRCSSARETPSRFTAFTSEANGLIKTIHDRQPVILERRDFAEWLAANERLPVHLLRIVPDERMMVNIVKEPGPAQAGLFG